MSANVRFKEEIISALNQLEEEKEGSANSSAVLLKLKDLILQELAILAKKPEVEINNFKALWGRRVRLATESLGLASCKKIAPEKTWRLILDQLPQSVAESSTSSSSDIIATTPSETNSSSKSSTSSLSYQQRLNTEDLLLFKSNYERIKNKWILSSGTCVEQGLKRSPEVKRHQKQIPGDHADLVFFHKSVEVGCLEIGLLDKGSNGTKELQEKSLKTPRMMKAFAMQAVDSFPAVDLANVKIVGIIISGMWIIALKMRFDHGSVSLMSTSKRLKMPESIEEVPSLLPPVLTLIYSHAQTIRKTAEYINDIATSVAFSSSSEPVFIPPCFAPSTKACKKRKS